MSRPSRIILAVALPGVVLVLALCFPRVVLQEIVLPTATVLWLILRIFVLSIDQEVYWWGLIGLAAFGAIALLLQGSSSRAALHTFSASTAWDPSRRWRDSILLNTDAPPARDSFRRDLAWLLSSLYASPRFGSPKYQVREALQDRRIPLPKGIHEFLFESTRLRDPAPPFFVNPRRSIQAAVDELSEAVASRARRRRRQADYFRSADEVLAFMETQLEMTHELDPDA